MKKLKMALSNMDINFDNLSIDKYEKYMEGILEWNEKINLTAIKDRDDFVMKHYIDSLLCYPYLEGKKNSKIIDVGTGGGFPGIPLALVMPQCQFTLMDSLNKRLKVIDHLCEELQVVNVKTLHGRAEEIGQSKEHREEYDICVSRAVANLSTLSEYTLPLVKVGGRLIALKGPEIDNEIIDGEYAINLLGGKIVEIIKVKSSTFEYDHRIVIVEKIKNTKAKYPRKAGTPSKEPIRKQ